MSSVLPSVDRLITAVRAHDRAGIAQAITLVESTAPRHFAAASELIRALTPFSGTSVRVGITGVPGAGKSTFIERFGLMRAEAGAHVAVLAVDPSSPRSGGSLLGDKTRMEELSRHPRCFVRPSPSRGSLGGIARATREAICILEAAGFDTIIVETVGVGQSEVAVRSVTDFFVLLCITGAGDELQGFKKGVIELADVILVNKADGDNEIRARQLTVELNRILRYIPAASTNWRRRAMPVSALSGAGIAEAWEEIAAGLAQLKTNGDFDHQRAQQLGSWIEKFFTEEVERSIFARPGTVALRDTLKKQILRGELTPREAVAMLLAHLGIDTDTSTPSQEAP